MQSCSHMNQSEPPSGNVCWSFQVLFPSREHEREGEINLEQLQEAKDSDNSRSGIKRGCAPHLVGFFGVLVFSEDTLCHILESEHQEKSAVKEGHG